MFDTLLLATALLAPAKPTEDRLPPVQGYVFQPRTEAVQMTRESRLAPLSEAVALATRPTVQAARPNIWAVNE